MEKDISAIVCPYDKNHIIHKSRIQRHLLKCSQNFPSNYLEKCPFNATHCMKQSELAFHIEHCPDRKYIDSERCRLEVKKHGSLRPCPPSKAESCIDIYSDLWEDSDNQTLERSDASVISESPTIIPPRNNKIRRLPYGCSEAIMLEFPEDSHEEDLESVTSRMALGRGKFMSHRNKKDDVSRVGKGRGYFISEMLKGASATTDVEDTESVTSSVGRGSINYQKYLRSPGKSSEDPFLQYINRLPGSSRKQT